MWQIETVNIKTIYTEMQEKKFAPAAPLRIPTLQAARLDS